MIKGILNLILISIFVVGCYHAGSEVNSHKHLGKIMGQVRPPEGSGKEKIGVTVVLRTYNDSLRSLRVPQYEIDSSIKPIIFHSDSLGFINKDSIPPGRYEVTVDGWTGSTTRVGDKVYVDADGGLLTLKLFDFCVMADSISTINVKMWSDSHSDIILNGGEGR